MSSKSNGANHGARRVIKATSWSPARVKPPKKKPHDYKDEEDEKNLTGSRRS